METSAPRTARARIRAELTAEIKDQARAQLAADGAHNLSLRAIAREMGMASSALFRYFPSRDALITALIIDSYAALADAAEAAEGRAHTRSVLDRWMAICHGVRDWAVGHPHEYALIFGSPIPGYVAPPDTVAPASRVPLLLSALLADLLASGHYDPTAHPEVSDAVVQAVGPVRGLIPEGAPADLIVRGLMAWTYLFGAVSFEVFGHRHYVIDGAREFFDHETRRLAVVLGLDG